MARIAHEDRHPEEAETWLRRAFAFDPWWMPSDYDCPLRFRPIVARLRPPSVASAPDASGTLSVRAPREGCTVSVDDARSASTAQTVEQSLPARTHRVSLRCGEASRVRTVTVTAGRSTSLSLDPRLDALLRVAGLPGLNYPTAPESPAVVISDAAAVGSALGATRVVLLSGDRPMVVDVRRGELVHDEMSAQVERALGVGHGLPATVNQPPAVDPRVDVRPAPPSRGPGAGPWILMGAGVASLAAGGVLFYLRGAPLDTFERLCPDGDCGDSVSSEEQTAHDDALLYTTLSFVAGGVGVAAIAGGALWYALAPRRAEGTALRVTPWTTARSGWCSSLHADFEQGLRTAQGSLDAARGPMIAWRTFPATGATTSHTGKFFVRRSHAHGRGSRLARRCVRCGFPGLSPGGAGADGQRRDSHGQGHRGLRAPGR